ncbi:hypothetical protein SAMN03097699_2046 [Flavobacteriaceae bacterium MAR_2010_188]|nr:hypothetical protein SAMN03097699_2046 [Flavobacteriaceae bacterium MAR_2010_188]
MIFNSQLKMTSKNKGILFSILFIGMLTISWTAKNNKSSDYVTFEKDSIASAKAFLGVYEVLMSPRCLNCHPKGDVPLQGDDSHLHTMLPKRGTDGKGIYAMKCTNCHQKENSPGLHAPPGNSVWHLPPADMKMVFEGKTPYELATQMLDPKRNGNKTTEELIEHVSADSLVLWGWKPGEGRSLPPMAHDKFAEMFKTWIEKGSFAPDRNLPAKMKPSK